MANKRKYKRNRQEAATVNAIDRIAALRHFEESIAPMLRSDYRKTSVNATEMYQKYEKLAAARAITIAATEADSGKALSAIKDILDRAQGKAIERKLTTHRLAGLSDEELNAYVATKIQDSSVPSLSTSLSEEESVEEVNDEGHGDSDETN